MLCGGGHVQSQHQVRTQVEGRGVVVGVASVYFDLSHCCRVTMRYGGSDITRMFYWLLTQVSYTFKQFVDPASFSIPLLFLISPSPPFHLPSSIPSTSTLPSSLSPQLSLLPSPFSITLPFHPLPDQTPLLRVHL